MRSATKSTSASTTHSSPLYQALLAAQQVSALITTLESLPAPCCAQCPRLSVCQHHPSQIHLRPQK